MTDAERIARLERLVKTLLRGTAPGTFGVHRTWRADPAELAAALTWLNSDEDAPQDAATVVLDLDAAMVQKAVVAARKRGKR